MWGEDPCDAPRIWVSHGRLAPPQARPGRGSGGVAVVLVDRVLSEVGAVVLEVVVVVQVYLVVWVINVS